MTEFVAHNWVLLLLAGAGALIVAFMLTEDAPVARRVFARFLFNIALPLGVIFGLPLVLLAALTDIETQLWAAIVAGSVIATGWLTSTIFSELGKTQLKNERLRDYHKALYAEIGNTLAAYYVDGEADQFAQGIVTRMEADAAFVPFIPREAHDRVFSALVDEVEVLPRQTIGGVIAFYALVGSIGALADDMRSETFRTLEQERRILIYRDYVEMRKRAARMGEYVLHLIKVYSDAGASAAELFSRKVNRSAAAKPSSPDVGLHHPSKGSE